MKEDRNLFTLGFISPPVIYIFISAILLLVSLSSHTTSPGAQNNIVDIIPERSGVAISTTTNVVPIVNKEVNSKNEHAGSTSVKTKNTNQQPATTDLYEVIRVVDGDTIDVSIGETIQRLRLIGMNTPETVDPRKPVECFGVEASNKAKSVLSGKKVKLESDITQGELDKYDRLLRYVFLEDGTNFNLFMIKEGYAYEYTYELSYKYQNDFKGAQKYAQDHKLGLWGDICQKDAIVVPSTVVVPATPTTETTITPATPQNNCTIKGNINSKKEKIYHMIGCGSYNQTVIDISAGERWFCTEQEALNAGWRRALNCN